MVVAAVLFDLYDTLVYSTRTRASERAARVLTEAGLDPDAWRDAWHDLLPYSLRGEITLLERVRRALRAIGGPVEVDPGAGADSRSVLADELAALMYARNTLHLYADVRHALADLRRRGYALGLVSNIAGYRVGWLRELELTRDFDALALSCELGAVKPEPRIFLWARERLGVSSKECVFVGDGMYDELSAARRLGMTAVRIDRRTRDDSGPRDRGFDFRADALQGLLEWLPARAAAPKHAPRA